MITGLRIVQIVDMQRIMAVSMRKSIALLLLVRMIVAMRMVVGVFMSVLRSWLNVCVEAKPIMAMYIVHMYMITKLRPVKVMGMCSIFTMSMSDCLVLMILSNWLKIFMALVGIRAYVKTCLNMCVGSEPIMAMHIVHMYMIAKLRSFKVMGMSSIFTMRMSDCLVLMILSNWLGIILALGVIKAWLNMCMESMFIVVMFIVWMYMITKLRPVKVVGMRSIFTMRMSD